MPSASPEVTDCEGRGGGGGGGRQVGGGGGGGGQGGENGGDRRSRTVRHQDARDLENNWIRKIHFNLCPPKKPFRVELTHPDSSHTVNLHFTSITGTALKNMSVLKSVVMYVSMHTCIHGQFIEKKGRGA